MGETRMSYVNNIQMLVRVFDPGSMSAAARDQRTSPAVAPALPTQLSSLSRHRRRKDPKARLFTDYMATIIRDATRRAMDGPGR